jgi:hypothetical protein
MDNISTLSDDELSLQIDTACQSDRAFFRQHPQRNFRLRPARAVEIEDFARRDVITRELPDDLCWWIIVQQLIPHKIRLRWPLSAPHYFFPDPPEKIARRIWRQRVPRNVRNEWQEFARDAEKTLKHYGEIP